MTRMFLLAALALMGPTILVPAAAQTMDAGRGSATSPDARTPEEAPEEAEAASESRPRRSTLRFGAENVLAEIGTPTGNSGVDSAWTLRAAPYLLWQPDRAWEIRLGVMGDGQGQSGAPDFTRWRGDLSDSYVRWRSGGTRLTAGAQTILWGRVDGVPVIDRVSRVDLTRLLLDDLADRRRAWPTAGAHSGRCAGNKAGMSSSWMPWCCRPSSAPGCRPLKVSGAPSTAARAVCSA